jgi:hypothetical protein
MKRSHVASVLLSLATHTTAQHLESYNFPGYGFAWYDPPCAFACWSALSSATLSCTSTDHSHSSSHHASPTTPECQANDTALLTSVAYCMNEFCPDDVTAMKREEFWGLRMLDTTGTVRAKWTYGQALAEVVEVPREVFNSSSEEVLGQTVRVDRDVFGLNNRFNVLFDHVEMLQSKYA